MKEDVETEDVETKDELETPEALERKQNVVASPPERDESGGLFHRDRATELRGRWSEIQARFVDDPREAVKAADTLVDEVIQDLTALFAEERVGLESHSDRSEEVSTEDLRVALRRYRSFFERLLAV